MKNQIKEKIKKTSNKRKKKIKEMKRESKDIYVEIQGCRFSILIFIYGCVTDDPYIKRD